MNCFTVLGIEPTTEKKKIKRAYAAKSREFHPEEHPEEFQRIHDAYEEALAWAERNVESEVGPADAGRTAADGDGSSGAGKSSGI